MLVDRADKLILAADHRGRDRALERPIRAPLSPTAIELRVVNTSRGFLPWELNRSTSAGRPAAGLHVLCAEAKCADTLTNLKDE
jgi:hypothetical protein